MTQPVTPFTTFEAALQRVAKAILVFAADWIDPAEGIHALWAGKRRVYGLAIGPSARIPHGFRVEEEVGEMRAIVPDLNTVAGRAIEAQLLGTSRPTRLVAGWAEA